MNDNDINKVLTAVAKALLGFLLTLGICAMLPSCKRVEYFSGPECHTDTLQTVQLQRDSVYLRDSVYVTKELRGDTLYLTTDRWRIQYRDRLRVDTAYISKMDSVTVVKEVERKLTKWQSLKMNVGGGAMVAALVMLGVFVWRKSKPKTDFFTNSKN